MWRRNPMLRDESKLNRAQKAEDNERLFFGDRRARMDQARQAAQIIIMAELIEIAIQRIEERPDFEEALELLVATRWAGSRSIDRDAARLASAWEGRLNAVLARHEFGLTPEVLSGRLAVILGLPISEGQWGWEGTPPGTQVGSRAEDVAVGDGSARIAPSHSEGSQRAIGPTPNLEEIVLTEVQPSLGPELNHSSASKAGPDRPVAPLAEENLEPEDPDLARITSTWPRLPAHVKSTILMLVEASELVQPGAGN